MEPGTKFLCALIHFSFVSNLSNFAVTIYCQVLFLATVVDLIVLVWMLGWIFHELYVALLWGCYPLPYHDGKLATFNLKRTPIRLEKKNSFKSHSSVSSLNGFSCLVFIGVQFLSVNPGAFPEEVKSEQTTIKLIEAARYQLRCRRPLWGILHWPCRTWARCYLSKFNLWPAAADPAAAPLCECFWLKRSLRNTRGPDYHAAESPPAVGQMWTPRIGSVVPICSTSLLPLPNCSLILLLGQLAFNLCL